MWECQCWKLWAEVRPSLEILCFDKKSDCERENERDRKKNCCLLSCCCCLKMENYCIQLVPQICPQLCSEKHRHTCRDTHTHTHKPPLAVFRSQEVVWVRATWWRYHLSELLRCAALWASIWVCTCNGLFSFIWHMAVLSLPQRPRCCSKFMQPCLCTV